MIFRKSDNPASLRSRPEQKKKVKWSLTVLLLLGAALGLHLVCQFIGTLDLSRGRFSSYFHFPTIFLLNFLPVLLLMVLSYCVFNRAWAAYLFTGILTLLLEFINYFKIQVRGDPFVFDDIYVAGEAMGLMDQISLDIPLILYLSVALLIVGSVVLALFARGRVPTRRWWLRPIAGVLCLLTFLGAWKLFYTDAALYSAQKNFYFFQPERDSENRASRGFFWSFLRSVDESGGTVPEGYSDEAAQALLGQYADADIPDKVNVIVTMLESYSDFSAFDELSLKRDPYTDFHALQDECFHGVMIADTVGGGTINAERSMMTGFTFPQPLYRRSTVSFVRYFKAQGYTVQGGHPGFDWFYSRKTVNQNLGFDSYNFMENHYEALMTGDNTYNEHPDDATFFADQVDMFRKRDISRPYFSFGITYQNHCPYVNDRLLGAEYVSHEGLSDEAYYIVNNYLSGIEDTGRQLAGYVDAFRDSEEPVVLLLFGDHKPSLGQENSAYDEMGINILEGTADGYYNLYSTPYLIWANDAAKQALGQAFTGEGDTISPCYLLSELFDCCGWDGPAWMQYQREARDRLSILTERLFCADADGRLCSELTAEQLAARREYKIAEYYMRKQTPE